MNSINAANIQYARWFDQRIEEYVSSLNHFAYSSYMYVRYNGFLVTFTFDRSRIYARKRSDAFSSQEFGSPEMFNLNHFYNVVSRRLIGRHFMRPSNRDKLPLMIASLDVNGTRYWKTVGEAENVHVHSIWIFNRGQAVPFQFELADLRESLEFNQFDFSQIDVQPVTSFKTDEELPSQLSSYVGKFHGFNSVSMLVSDDLLILPRQWH